MKLAEIVGKIRIILEEEDKVKKEALEGVWDSIRLSGEAISAAHKFEFEEAIERASKAKKRLDEIGEMLEKHPTLYYSNLMMTAYQEYTEGRQLISLLKDNVFLTPEELGVPYKSYLSGIGDLVGELRRSGLNAIRQENVKNAEHILDLMEEIFESLSSVEYPKSLVPGLRRKCDIARALLERTRGDVMNAIQREKLVKEMRKLTQELMRHSQETHD
ncbi:MAG: hypothetical protein ACFE7E_02740 [Candidatus Hodarchaeota archaeon]